ncbi:conserved hypothetical protein [Talaromyces stipitatus ATCC 10500]|uniref:NAD(P)-binding domain-containing protein n=1 Tax=Talaromyces stipitatus (strain ATCC 10500 / CBS 375.48 / QM 6759 / NRRL 1006) TaxID=441959 RepID=B8M0A1_TALSN|nr:uncharacterized protein TSTA_084290 [Talaromyces stipitatus ATCC 10500]EED21198.1 conserved hypothetical protein [Talaromyces stipitatus ATCC 10500]
MKLPPKVLILGGHSKVALLLTSLLIARGCGVISLTNNPEHRSDILNLRQSNREGNVEVLVTDLEHIDTAYAARALLDRVDANYVIWMAATFSSSKISKFLMVSYLSSRGKKPEPGMTDRQWNDIANADEGQIPIYEKEKIEAEEFLDAMTAWRRRQAHLPAQFQSIHVMTGGLSDLPGRGKISLHPEPVSFEGEVSRQDVAEVIDQLLARSDTNGRYGVLGGENDIETAIAKAVGSQQLLAEGPVYKNIVGGFIPHR